MNPTLFRADKADTKNAAGGDAYSMSPEESLAQLVCTGFLSDTYYTKAEDNLQQVLAFAAQCSDEFVAKLAVYGRQHAYMKDTPALLVSLLYCKGSPLTEAVFPQVIDNVKMLSNFVQVIRSGALGRRSLGTRGKRLLQKWLQGKGTDYLFRQSVGKDPSLADIIALSHHKPDTPDRAALYSMLRGREFVRDDLPGVAQQVLDFRDCNAETDGLPDVPFQVVDSLPLRPIHWRQLFERGGYQFIRMNLNTAQRHDVFKDTGLVKLVAERLSDREAVRAARQFPYQILQAYKSAASTNELPRPIVDALHTAMEHATENVPGFEGEVYVAVDMSGSMASSVTGGGRGHVSATTCADAAALFAACILRNSPQAKVMTFSSEAKIVPVDPRETVMTTARTLAQAGGGTDCSSPMRLIESEKRHVDLFILVSDNESWLDSGYWGARLLDSGYWGARSGVTGTVETWKRIKRRCPKARQIRINVQPNATDQLPKRSDTLRVGGFSDAVFTACKNFAENRDWVLTVRAVEL